MSAIRVAHVTTIDMSLRYLLLNQLHALQQAGYDVTGISAPGPDVPALEAAGIRHLAVPITRRLTPLADLRALWQLYRTLRRERFTIVHTHNPKPGLLGQLAARMAGVPIVVNTLHGFYFHDDMHPLARRFYILTEKIAARCSDLILSQNAEDVQTCVRERIAPARRIRHLGNGIDLSRFDPKKVTPDERARKRAELGIPDEAPVVGFVGRLVAEKGVPELLEAAKTIRADVPEVRFLLVGPIDHHKPDAVTPGLAARHGVDDACVFTGLRHDLPALYALMDVFVLPSHREGFPRAPMEASAMGIPCVITDVRGCREAVTHGENGLLVPPRAPAALAAAVLSLLRDPARARRMGRAGRLKAERAFDERRIFAAVLAAYDELMAARGLTAPPGRDDPEMGS